MYMALGNTHTHIQDIEFNSRKLHVIASFEIASFEADTVIFFISRLRISIYAKLSVHKNKKKKLKTRKLPFNIK